jgi:predicted 2-oxoglutarate/Fe(II)-dependent dioxygenase YbiX
MLIQPNPIQPDEIIAGCIAIYKNIWSNPEKTIQTIKDVTNNPTSGIFFEKALTVRDVKQGKTSSQKRTNFDLPLLECAQKNEEFRKINNRFFETIYSATKAYQELMDIEEETHFVEGFNLLRYEGGQEYTAHYDGSTSSGRSISPILYLNDDYEGGELEFVNFNLKIKPEAGTLYLFPANYAYRHIAHPITNGTKYAIVTWLHDRPAG